MTTMTTTSGRRSLLVASGALVRADHRPVPHLGEWIAVAVLLVVAVALY